MYKGYTESELWRLFGELRNDGPDSYLLGAIVRELKSRGCSFRSTSSSL